MKLLKLTVKNFRGLKGDGNVIDFSNSDIIYLIGQNNVGKSTFLHAYEFFVGSKTVAQKEDFFEHNADIPIEMEAVFLKEDADIEDTALAGKEPNWVTKWVDYSSKIRIRKRWEQINGSFVKETFSPEQDQYILNGFGGLHTKLQSLAPEPLFINAMETADSLEEKVNKLMQDDFTKKIRDDFPDQYDAIVSSITALQDAIIGRDEVDRMNIELNENFQKVFSDLVLKIESKDGGTLKVEDLLKKQHSIFVGSDGADRRETFMQHGHGVIRQALFNFMTFLKREGRVTTRKEYLILFEEPELYLHPKIAFRLRQSLYELAENSPYQILCATHSPLMIDISKPHASLVRIAKENDGTTQTYQLETDVFQHDVVSKERVQMINRFNPHICESFYADTVILVEGDTETIVFRDLLSRFFPEHEIFVLNTGSKNNIPFFQKILTAFRIKHFVIHDGDDRLNRSGNVNSAWTLNERIWEKIEEANLVQPDLARRYVQISNFEVANGVTLTGKDKPIKAYEFIKDLNLTSTACCVEFIKDIVGPQVIMHDQAFIEANTPR